MRFTKYQHEQAIESLQEAMTQLEPNGDNCHCCGDSGHQAFECGHNPLVAMAICVALAKDAREAHDVLHNSGEMNIALAERYHEALHYLAGYDQRMGEVVGPARVSLPFESAEALQAALEGKPLPREQT